MDRITELLEAILKVNTLMLRLAKSQSETTSTHINPDRSLEIDMVIKSIQEVMQKGKTNGRL